MSLYKKHSSLLSKWYLKSARDLPWRNTQRPYEIWVSEIILQQTSVKQGLPYYNRFISSFPDVISLASADIDEVMKVWQGLGYYSRARNMHFTANYIVSELNGEFPQNYSGLLKLKGIGPYTAAAISSFCFGESVAVVDGNVKRFLSRLYGVYDPIDISSTEKDLKSIAQSMIDFSKPEIFNQAIMEFGAMLCTPKNPDCHNCVFRSDCQSLKDGRVDSTPQKSKSIVKKDRYFYYALFIDQNNKTILEKRSHNDIWKGLYQFPLLEFDTPLIDFPVPEDYNISSPSFKVDKTRTYKHVLTHQNIFASFATIHIESCPAPSKKSQHIIIDVSKIKQYAIPRLIDLYLADLSITLF